MRTRRKSSVVLGIIPIVASSIVWVSGTAMAQNQPPARGETLETRQETTQVVREEVTTTVFGRGVTGDTWRPPANELRPGLTQQEQIWYRLSTPGN